MQDTFTVIKQTKAWIKDVVIHYNFCPFAKREITRDSIYYTVVKGTNLLQLAEAIPLELMRLTDSTAIETTVIIYPELSDDFDAFLELVDMAESLLYGMHYEGTYQFAHFHPQYQFQGVIKDDPANFTNRSPFPILQILRAESIERVTSTHPSSELIPETNIETARAIGLQKWEQILAGIIARQ